MNPERKGLPDWLEILLCLFALMLCYSAVDWLERLPDEGGPRRASVEVRP